MANIYALALPRKYELRMKSNTRGGIVVYGDLTLTITLGVVTTQEAAIKLLDSYDSQLERRLKIAEMVDRDKMKNLGEIDAKNKNA